MKSTLKKIKGHTLKYGIYYFLIVAIPILCLTMNVDRAKGMQEELGTGGGGGYYGATFGKLERSILFAQTDFSNLGIPLAYIYDLSINGEKAFCIDPGIPVDISGTYENKGKIEVALLDLSMEQIKIVRHGVGYARSFKYTSIDYTIGQAVIWAGTKNITSDSAIVGIIVQAITKYCELIKDDKKHDNYSSFAKMWLNGTNEFDSKGKLDTAKEYYGKLKNSSYKGNLYLWESKCGVNQRFITGYIGKECTTEDCGKDITCGNGTPDKPTEPKPEVCDLPENLPKANIAGDCEVTSTYNDPAFETGCVIGKDKYLDTATLTGLAPNYCTLFCREDVKTGYPGSGYTFYAGRFFTVGSSPAGNSWGPVVIEGTRTCVMTTDKTGKTNGINTPQFIRDYDTANENMRNSYNNWKKEIKRAEAAQKAINAGQSCTYDCSYDEYADASCPGGAWIEGGSCVNGSSKPVGSPSCPSGYSFRNGGCYKRISQTCNSMKYPNRYGWSWAGGASGSEGGQACNGGAPSGYNSSYESAYYRYKAQVEALESALRQCAEMQIKYEFAPEISMNFSDGYYTYNNPLISSGAYGYVNVNNDGVKGNTGSFSSCSGSDCSLKYYACNGEVCYKNTSTVTTMVQNANSKNKTAINWLSASFKVGNTGYRYAKKTNGTVIGNLTNAEKDNGSYYDLGDWVIPLSFNLVPGSSYAPQLHYSKIGNTANKENQPHFDYLSSIHTEKKKTIIITGADNKIDDGSDYKCAFDLINDIECKGCANGTTPVGLDVIYRPIKLGSASVSFPGIKGNGRKPGANWSSSDIDKVITNNRGVKGDEVYNLDPIYTITLTPGIIKQIRQYNAAVNNYANFDMVCKDGKNCLSNFLHSTVKTGSGSFSFSGLIGGSCSNTSVNNFEACRGSGY